MENISRKILKCEVENYKKNRLIKNFQDALVLRQKVGNSIVHLEEKFLRTKVNMSDFL